MPESVEELDEILGQENDERYLVLRDANASLTRQLAKEKGRTAEMVSAAYRGARDAMSSLVIPAVVPPVFKAGKGKPEVCVPILSDLQLGKKTADYNSEVCAKRVDLYADKILELTDLQRSSHPVKDLSTAWIGDFVEGESIFPGQQWLLDSSLFRQICVDGPEILIPWIMKLAGPGGFKNLDIWCVDGNHGRIGRKGDFSPETNSDRMLYTIVKDILAREPKLRNRVKFHIAHEKPSVERNWYEIMEIGNYSALLVHGDQIRGNGPWHGVTLAKKVNGWAAGGLRGESFLDVYMGHYHQIALIPLNHRKVYCNGSTESSNDFAREVLSAQSDPKQWLLYVDPEKGRVTSSYDVELLGE